MMSLFPKAIIAGGLTGVLGLVLLVGLDFVGFDPEESIGLSLLFKLRGARTAPADVVVVTLDKPSADRLKLSTKPRKWPRSLHARLTEILSQQGAAVIAFDLIFDESRSLKDDELFSRSIQNAGNVVLCEVLKKDIIPLPAAKSPQKAGVILLETLEPPIQCLAKSALALAPFPLPKVPVKVSQYWAFKTTAGDTPTLPVVVFQAFALDMYDNFLKLLKEFVPTQTYALPQNKVEILKSKRLEKLVRVLRNILREKPLIAEKMLVKTQQWSGQGTESREIRILKSLIKMYKSPDSHFLNYYGPPTTINTVPYYQILQTRKEPTPKAKTFDLKGKAVFVGLSERFQLEQKDGFYTVFSQSNGVDLSGVEIAATAFANLLEDRPLRRFPIHTEAVFILLCGLILGFLCRIFSPGISAACVIGLSITYLTTAHFQFKNSANWYPIVLPLFFQAPLAFFGSLLWRYSDTNKERKRIRNALGYYLPDKVADQLAKKIRDLTEENQLVHGVCLFTDAGRYT
jgi:adenylate cyclase